MLDCSGSTLQSMILTIESRQNQSGLTRFFEFMKDPEEIQGLKAQLNEAVALFNVRPRLGLSNLTIEITMILPVECDNSDWDPGYKNPRSCGKTYQTLCASVTFPA